MVATPRLAEEMLDGQHQKVDIPAHVRSAHKGLLQKKAGRESLLNRLSCPPDDPIGRGTELFTEGSLRTVKKTLPRPLTPTSPSPTLSNVVPGIYHSF